MVCLSCRMALTMRSAPTGVSTVTFTEVGRKGEEKKRGKGALKRMEGGGGRRGDGERGTYGDTQIRRKRRRVGRRVYAGGRGGGNETLIHNKQHE